MSLAWQFVIHRKAMPSVAGGHPHGVIVLRGAGISDWGHQVHFQGGPRLTTGRGCPRDAQTSKPGDKQGLGQQQVCSGLAEEGRRWGRMQG